jgi:hypothetical protein
VAAAAGFAAAGVALYALATRAHHRRV